MRLVLLCAFVLVSSATAFAQNRRLVSPRVSTGSAEVDNAYGISRTNAPRAATDDRTILRLPQQSGARTGGTND